MIGQSNMAGRGFVREVPQILDEGIKMLRNGRWQMMTEPVNFDRQVAGISLAASFAATLRLNVPGTEIGLIPCAEGGSSLDEWAAGTPLFDNAVSQTQLALRNSKLAGILWHQGEADASSPELAKSYKAKLVNIITALRAALNADDIPLIIGGLGDFLTSGIYGTAFSSYPMVNAQLLEFAKEQPHSYFVTSAGLGANSDNIHFNAASLRVFGVRYAEAFTHQQHIINALPHEQTVLESIYTRPLTPAEKAYLLQLRFANGELSPDEFQRAWNS